MTLLSEDYLYDQICFEEARNEWEFKMSEEYLDSAKGVLNTDLSGDIVIDLATSLANNFICTHECKFFESFNLTAAHAYCFLNSITSVYEKQVDEAFQESLDIY